MRYLSQELSFVKKQNHNFSVNDVIKILKYIIVPPFVNSNWTSDHLDLYFQKSQFCCQCFVYC